MKTIIEVAMLAVLLSACGGPAARGQPVPPVTDERARFYPYEIPNERVARFTAAADSGWIQVTGTGSVQVAADRARVAFAMESRATTAEEAAGQNADAMDAVLNALRDAGLAGLDLETFGYSLRPEYAVQGNQRTREIVAYTALNNVGATIEDVDDVGRLIDVAVGAGANRVASITFFASHTDAAETDALAAAVANARVQAEVIAESLGYELGPPLEISGGAQRPTPPRPVTGMAFAAQERATTPIEAGEQTVVASVSIRFALGPEIGD